MLFLVRLWDSNWWGQIPLEPQDTWHRHSIDIFNSLIKSLADILINECTMQSPIEFELVRNSFNTTSLFGLLLSIEHQGVEASIIVVMFFFTLELSQTLLDLGSNKGRWILRVILNLSFVFLLIIFRRNHISLNRIIVNNEVWFFLFFISSSSRGKKGTNSLLELLLHVTDGLIHIWKTGKLDWRLLGL